MHKARRGAVIAGGLALTMALAACSSNSTGQTGNPEDTTTSNVTSSASQSETGITNPKNPAALEPCELLPTEAATTIGVTTKSP
ncbi:putative lipoprotein YbaY [Actinopolyspora lacussalsi]|nr:putative lipoprotein YbaY [Actinopolyspora lacussalsi]